MQVEVLLDRPASEILIRDNVRRTPPLDSTARLIKRCEACGEYSKKSAKRWRPHQELDQGVGPRTNRGNRRWHLRANRFAHERFESRKWLVISAATLGVLLQHSLTRRSLPIKALRAVRYPNTPGDRRGEICATRLRGDFDNLKSVSEESHRAIESVAPQQAVILARLFCACL
jgi:hypothetical protein